MNQEIEMRENRALVALIFVERGVGHTHILVDAEWLADEGASEENIIEWAYEKFGNGREVVGVEFGTESYVAERIKLVHGYSVEVPT
jgi:hypothetical protein